MGRVASTKRVVHRRPIHRSNRKPKPPAAAIIVRPPSPKPWMISSEELTIIKNAICKGATDAELEYCLAVARRHELDPFKQQIWFVPRRDRDAQQTDGARGSKIWVPVVGINGLLHVAARDHRDFGSYSEPEYGPMITVKWKWNGEGRERDLKVPEWSRIEARKKGCEYPTVAKIWWEEIYPNIDYAPLVRQMPRLMLAKCAKANATRTAYPSTGGLLIQEETYGKEFTQFTPEGRLVTEATNPALDRYKEKEKQEIEKLTPEQREVVERRMREAEEKKKGQPAAQPQQTIDIAPVLLYEAVGESFKVSGPSALFEKLGFRPEKTSVVMSPEQLGKALSVCEQRTIPIRAKE